MWISVSLGLMVICGTHVLRRGDDRRLAAAAVALVCLACLLFPVISATDDVNAASPALVETNKFKRLVASAPALLTLLSWPSQGIRTEVRWASADLAGVILPPPSDAFSFPLHRRPPPLAAPTA